MAMQDRDYYKQAWDRRDRGDIRGYHTGRFLAERIAQLRKTVHPVLLFIFTFALCLGVFLVLNTIAYFVR
jgi:hypothetical protein